MVVHSCASCAKPRFTSAPLDLRGVSTMTTRFAVCVGVCLVFGARFSHVEASGSHSARTCRVYTVGSTWESVTKNMLSTRRGHLLYRIRLKWGSRQTDGIVRADWNSDRVRLEILSPDSARSILEARGRMVQVIVGQTETDFKISDRQRKASDPSMTPPYCFASVLAMLHDPLCFPWIDLPGAPNREEVGPKSTILYFPVPTGYDGPGYSFTIDRSTMLPKVLHRSGEGMPELEVSYQFGSQPEWNRLRAAKTIEKTTAPSVGLVYERSRFRPLVENIVGGRGL